MSEERRIIKEYKPRLKIPTSTLSSEAGYALYCLPKAGAHMLNRILGYLVREVTFIDESINDQCYYGPTTAQWELAVDLAGEIGAALVSECEISDIVAQLATLNTTMGDISACVCALQLQASSDTSEALQNVGSEYEPSLADQILIDARPVPALDAEKCDLANVIWGFQKQWITESVLPFLSSAVDATSIAIGATSAFAVATAGLGLPVAMATSILSIVANMLIDTSVENLLNWMISNAQEVVCHLYNGMVSSGYTEAALLAQLHIDQSGLPLGDRMMLKLTLTAEFYMQAVDKLIEDGDLNPLDYDDYLCTSCDDYEYNYFYDGVGCPVGGLIGSSCGSGWPQVDVTNTAETDNPPLILTAPQVTTYHVYIRGYHLQGNGTSFQATLRRGVDDVLVESKQFTVDQTSVWTTYELTFDAYPITGTYIKITANGASAARFAWLGVDLE